MEGVERRTESGEWTVDGGEEWSVFVVCSV